jgi:hypothetical protein
VGDPVQQGPRWGCISLARSSRFAVAWNARSSEAEAAPEVVRKTRERTARGAGCLWISDGHAIYSKSIRRIYRDPLRTGRVGRPRMVRTPGVGLTQVVKHRKGRRVVKVEVRHRFGPVPSCPHTVRQERLNGVLRDHLACLTRKTHAFAKRVEMWDAAVTLSLFEHNWLRPHSALRQQQAGLPNGRRYIRRSPAMAIGLTDHVWSWIEFLTCRVLQRPRG